jgi:glycosyltransferase involved in cell wall biosynthesis
MKVSVALCTFNGGPFLGEQLQSIAAQDRPPDEWVICDDGSTDETLDTIGRFARSVSLPVRLELNAERLGSSANFAKAIGMCRGEWIFLADQDDFWLPCKVRRMLEAAAQCPQAGFVFSDAMMVDGQRRRLGYNLWEAIRFRRPAQRRFNRQQAIDVLVQHNVVSGTTMAFRAEYRDLVLPIPPGWVHDGWIALLIAAVAPALAIPEPLVEYRQHGQQQIGEKKRNLYQQYLRGKRQQAGDFQQIAANYAAARQRLLGFSTRLRDRDLLHTLAEKTNHFQAKAQMRSASAWRLPIIVGELLRHHYGRYSSGWKSLAQDLFL